jgi:hypothetical protein
LQCGKLYTSRPAHGVKPRTFCYLCDNKLGLELKTSKLKTSKLKISKLKISKLKISKLKISKLKTSKLKTSKLKISKLKISKLKTSKLVLVFDATRKVLSVVTSQTGMSASEL